MLRNLYLSSESGDQLVASFEMIDGHLQETWRNPLIREEISSEGISSPDGEFHPKDGKPFFDALKTAFVQSTFLYVKDE